jgi:hypothetical protein
MPIRAPSCAEHAALIRREDLERRFDGPIPPQLLEPKSERTLMIEHHRAMIRFSDTRLQDFAQALMKLKTGPQGPATEAWIARTVAILADHQAEKERHQRDLAALVCEQVPPIAAE